MATLRTQVRSLTARELWLLALPLVSSAIRGFAQPVIKLGLERWHNPIAAVVIGYTVSSAVLILAALVPGPCA
jgi:hypothetical protein